MAFLAPLNPSAHSETIIIPITLRSWVQSNGYYPGANATSNYVALVGSHNNFFAWNLSGRSAATISSATLYLNSSNVSGSGTYSIYDVSSSTASLLNPGNTLTSVAAFSDLGGGNSYGSTSYSSASNGQYSVINFNTAGIAALQAAWGVGFFDIGGAAVGTGMIFGGSSSVPTSQTYLSVDIVPEPSALSLLVVGLGGVIALRRVRRKAD